MDRQVKQQREAIEKVVRQIDCMEQSLKLTYEWNDTWATSFSMLRGAVEDVDCLIQEDSIFE